ncbi:MAG: hypothetical protein IPL52_11270 [Flavobacteriales bacterium]|nr:hypothetical protein [Flavobacteriales bacterium]
MKNLTTSILLISSTLVQAQNADGDMLAGMSALRNEEHKKAEEAFTRAALADPANAKTWYYRGVTRLGSNDLVGAVQDFDHALSLEPDDVHSVLRRAEVRARQGAEATATKDLLKIVNCALRGPLRSTLCCTWATSPWPRTTCPPQSRAMTGSSPLRRTTLSGGAIAASCWEPCTRTMRRLPTWSAPWNWTYSQSSTCAESRCALPHGPQARRL